MEKIIKPCLAQDVVEDRLKFPLWMLPKVDGCWSAVQNGKLFARSLKPFENKYTQELYSRPELEGLRGEMIAGTDPAADDLCRKTASALSTIEGQPQTLMCCFDLVTPETEHLPYKERYAMLRKKVKQLSAWFGFDVDVITVTEVNSLEEYRMVRDGYLEQGFEGCIVRDPDLPHKEGRSSTKVAHCWRYKPWSSAEIKVTELIEEQQNNNEAKTNALGRTERSSHKANLTGKQTLGAIVGVLVTPVKDSRGKIVTPVGTELTISTGNLTAQECKDIWGNPESLLGKVVEFEYMSHGLKDKPRFAQFKRIRAETDMS